MFIFEKVLPLNSKAVIRMMARNVNNLKNTGIVELQLLETIEKLWKPFVQEAIDTMQSIDEGL